jgi:hypothetical protein
MGISWSNTGIPSYGSGVEEDAFNNPSGIGSYDWGSSDTGTNWNSGFDIDKSGLLAPRTVGTGRGETTSKALEALNKAIAYQGSSQSARTGGTTASAGSGRVEKVNDSLSIIYPGQKQTIPNSGGGGGGIFGSIGQGAGLLGSALGVFGPLGAPIGAFAGGLIDRAVR